MLCFYLCYWYCNASYAEPKCYVSIYVSGTVMQLMLNPSAMFWLETPVMITVQFCLFPVMITTDVPVGQRLLLVFDLDGRVGHALFIVILD